MNNSMIEVRKFFVLIIIFLDVVWLLSSFSNMDITIFKKSNFIVPIVLNIILFFWLSYKSKGGKLALFIVLISFSILLLIKHAFTPLFDPYSYEYLHIPRSHNEIVVEHRANLIDQGITEYRVYQTRIRGLLLTELTTKKIVIEQPHHMPLSQDYIFDYSNPMWTRETVSFDTYEGKLTFKLK